MKRPEDWEVEDVVMCAFGALIAAAGVGQLAAGTHDVVNAWIMVVVGAGAVLVFGGVE